MGWGQKEKTNRPTQIIEKMLRTETEHVIGGQRSLIIVIISSVISI